MAWTDPDLRRLEAPLETEGSPRNPTLSPNAGERGPEGRSGKTEAPSSVQAPSPPGRGERAGVRGAIESPNPPPEASLSRPPYPTSGAAQAEGGRGGTRKELPKADLLAPRGPNNIAPGIARGPARRPKRSPWRRRLRRLLTATAALSALLLAIGLVAAWWVPLPERLAETPSTVVAFADGSPAHVFLSPDDKYRMAVTVDDLDAIDPDYLDALLRFEDRRFPIHPGVDPLAIARSAAVNVRHGRVMSGASTLTMQLVRLLEPRPRTLRSKAIEALRALQLELHLSKDEVLAAYLSFLPFGRNVEGLPAATWAYFGHGPQDLSFDEIAVLLAVPQRPTRRFPAPKNLDALRDARDEIAGWLVEDGFEPIGLGSADTEHRPEALVAEVRAARVPPGIRPLPRHAPHAAIWLVERFGTRGTTLHTTLDRGTQRLAEEQLARRQAAMAHQGIHNGAAVVLDHRKGTVAALVGNFDFWDDEHGGQIPGFAVPRSPGSALKPFIYALAIDRGLVLPEHLVTDVPVAYTDYAPQNYDGRFTGLVSLEDALSHSLNIPFVRLLGELGVERFVGTLSTAGVEGLDPRPGYYGLSAAIGALELSLLELAALYAGLARDGHYRPVALRVEDLPEGPRTTHGTALFSPGAAHLTRRALRRRDRPDFPDRHRLSGAPPAIHWKTGTSYGHRDAWAAGSDPRHTAVVWLGNFDNTPSVDLVGADAAGPVLFDLLEALRDRTLPSAGDPPTRDLKQVEVCAYSGHLPTHACPQREWAHGLRDRIPTQRCPYHVAVDVDLDTGLALNPTCRAGRRFERRSFLRVQASVRRWLAHGHRWMPGPPSLDPACRATEPREPPSILSPPAHQVLVLLPGIPTDRQEIPLQAESNDPSARLSWFVDGEFLGTAPADERLWWRPVVGEHTVVVVDDQGQTSRRRLAVRSRS